MTTIPLPFASALAISAHTFNKTGDRCAVAAGEDGKVTIFAKEGAGWKVESVLDEHDKLVTSIDWGHTTNRIVTCSQDRNAYVWTFDEAKKTWKPTLVLLRINRAATYVKWSPLENKFAVASGARCISICYFESENDWWVSKQIKKPIRSTILSLSWHPNNVLLAAGSADMTARVISAWVKGVDDKPPPSPWGDKLPFNTVCAEYKNAPGGWVTDIAFSPDGNAVAWVAQDSSLRVSYPASSTMHAVRTSQLPFTSLLWVNGSSIVVAGFDCVPILFSGDEKGGWRMDKKVDQGAKKSVGDGSAMDKFKQLDSRSQASTSGSDVALSSVHQNSISLLVSSGRDGETMKRFTSSGVDGRVVQWVL